MARSTLMLSFLVTVAAVSGLFTTLDAQDLAWRSANADVKSRILSVAVGPHGEVYASDDSGYVIRADLNGADWQESSVGLDPSQAVVDALLAHPSGRVFAASRMQVYASDDEGKHWTRVGLWGKVSRTLGCTSRGTVLVGSSNGYVLRSTNLGASWVSSALPLGPNEPAFLALDTAHVFAGTARGIFCSQDDGLSWFLTDSSTLGFPVRALAYDVTGRLYAAGDSGMYVSADSGVHWTKGAGVPGASAVCEDGDAMVCSGSPDGSVYRSTDGGLVWQPTGATLATTQRCLTTHPTWKTVAGTTTGIARSVDQGATWARRATGFVGRHIGPIAVSGSRVVLADRDSGLYSTIGGKVWSRSVSPRPAAPVQCLIGTTPEHFYAGTEGDGMYRTSDGGVLWVAANSGLTEPTVYSLAKRSEAILFAGTGSGVFRTADSGATWIPRGVGLPATPVRALVLCPGSIVIAGTGGSGIFRSTDDGNSWMPAAAGPGHQDVRVLVRAPGDGVLFAGTNGGGVYASSDLGITWTHMSSGLTDPLVNSLAINGDGDLIAGTPSGIFRSREHNAAFTPQSSGFPSAPVTALAMVPEDLLLAGTNGAGLWVTPTAAAFIPAGQALRWMATGTLQNFFWSYGCEYESVRAPRLQDGWRWPAQYAQQDMQASKGLWIGTTNYTDTRGRTFRKKVVHIGPRGNGMGEFFPVSLTCIARVPRPIVTVRGVRSKPPIVDSVDAIDPTLPVERIITNTVNTSIGITMHRRVLQSSHTLHDNYIVQEFTFVNTGNTDTDAYAEQAGVTLDSVYFYFLYRLAICADVQYVIGNATSWGYNAMLDTRGDGVRPDPPGQQLRAQIAWHGKYPPFKTYDNIGGPIWTPYYDKTDTVGRLGAAQVSGVLTVHADGSANGRVDDPAQPSTTSWENSDGPTMIRNSETDTAMMKQEFALMTRGHRNPRHAWYVEPSGDFTNPTGDPAAGTPGGHSIANGYGPYTLGPGDSVRIVLVEASAGLSRKKCIAIGGDFKRGAISAQAKNDSVLTGRDSLFQTFRRAMAAYANGYAVGLPPYPPTSFSVAVQAGGIQLAWDVSSEPGPAVTGYRIYRAPRAYAAEHLLLAQLPADARSYKDSSIVRGVDYYYYITSVGDSLESSRFYTQTYDPVVVPLSVEGGQEEIPASYMLDQNYPNPFNPVTTIRYALPGRSKVMLAVFNVVGQRVAVPEEGDKAAGHHEVQFDARALPSGVYFYRLEARPSEDASGADGGRGAGVFTETKRMVVIR